VGSRVQRDFGSEMGRRPLSDRTDTIIYLTEVKTTRGLMLKGDIRHDPVDGKHQVVSPHDF